MVEPQSEWSARERFVRRVWADHGDSPVVKRRLGAFLAELRSDQTALNVGCGDTRLGSNILNTDVDRMPAVDCQADAARLPFPDSSFQAVVSQETVEHLPDPFAAIREMVRVLRPGGALYLQVPFVIGYHPGPEDYWRFTGAGMRRLLEQAGLRPELVIPSVGAGTGLHRILVEFLAGIASRLLPASYLPVKAGVAVLFYPLKWLDGWLMAGSQVDRIPGGYIGIGRKPS